MSTENDYELEYDGEVYEVNGQQMTGEELLQSYQKLQKEFTKVTQKNSQFSKENENVKQWVEWDNSLKKISEEKGIDVRALAGSQINSLIESIMSGNVPTNSEQQSLEKAINKAEKKGDSETVQQLNELQSYVSEQILTNAITEIFESFEEEGYDVDPDDFEEFVDTWLEDLGYDEEDEFDPKLLRKAAQAYEAKLLKESNRRRIPQLGTSGGASSPNRGKEPEKIGGIKGAAARAAEYLNNFR